MTDSEFVELRSEWPRWPVLPLKSRDVNSDHPEATGFLMAEGTPQRPMVYFGNVWQLSEIAAKLRKTIIDRPVTYKNILGTLKSREFSSMEELLRVYKID